MPDLDGEMSDFDGDKKPGLLWFYMSKVTHREAFFKIPGGDRPFGAL